MTAENPGGEEVWTDLEFLYALARQSDVEFNNQETNQCIIAVLAVMRNAGHVSDRMIQFGVGMATEYDVCRALTDTITSAFVALSYVTPDPREHWEIAVKQLAVQTGQPETP